MKAKWKNNKNLKPRVILAKLESIKNVSEDHRLSFPLFEYKTAMAALQNMVLFPDKTNSLNHESLVSTAIDNIAKNTALTESNVITEINSIIKTELATREHKYHMLTSISLKKPYPSKLIKIEDCQIRILGFNYPKKYTGRKTLINKYNKIKKGTSTNYAKVIVSVKAKSAKGAATAAFRALDIQRSIWCLFGNFLNEQWGNEWNPINKIRLGETHTIHKDNGKIATNEFWYESNFVEAKLFADRDPKEYSKYCKWTLNKLNKLPYKEELKNAMLRYVRALDERDQNVALIQLWGALEAIASPSGANYDLVTRRCAFLFKENDYHKQVLEHLREYRNRSIHAGDQSEKAKINCYLLQYYFKELVLFHLNFSGEFSSLNEANSFLDLPSNKKDLENKKQLIDKAIKFVS